MRNTLYCICLAIVLCSCEYSKDDHGNVAKGGIQMLSLDGCEYVVYLTSNSSDAGAAIVHAGNCHNPIHKAAKDYGNVITADTIIASKVILYPKSSGAIVIKVNKQ